MYFPLIFLALVLSFVNKNFGHTLRNDEHILKNRSVFNATSDSNYDHIRRKRYIGLSKRFKLNRRYQECIGPGDAKAHCKHLIFCPTPILSNSRHAIDYLCVIEKTHVGVCCPDDIALSGLAGSQIITDLPAGGNDYDENDNVTGCGLTLEQSSKLSKNLGAEWPWMAAIYQPKKMEKGDEQQFCGGTILTELHILTAAHCTLRLLPADIRVRLGEYDFKVKDETRALDYEVSDIINHENFEESTYANDIAIIKLANPTSFNSYIWPICLPPSDQNFENEIATVAGWGQKYYTGPVSEILLRVSVPVWPHEKCVNAFLQQITEDNLCAAAFDGGKDSCLGDSGGPLMYQLNNGRWVTIGIVSWGIGCGNKGNPGIYTKVSSYIPWIIKYTLTK